jgi:regulator of RNase E activity RraA
MMRKSVAVAGSVLITTALVGTTAAVTSAHEERTTKTLRFVDIGLRDSQLGKTTAAASGVDKINGKVVGYSALTGKFNPKTKRVHVQVAAALKGGIIVVSASQGLNDNSNRFHGRVLTGTGRFHDARGTFTARETSKTRTVVTIRYTTHR